MYNVRLVLFLWTLSLPFTFLIYRFNAWLKMSHASWDLRKVMKLHITLKILVIKLSVFQLQLYEKQNKKQKIHILWGCLLCEHAKKTQEKCSFSNVSANAVPQWISLKATKLAQTLHYNFVLGNRTNLKFNRLLHISPHICQVTH